MGTSKSSIEGFAGLAVVLAPILNPSSALTVMFVFDKPWISRAFDFVLCCLFNAPLRDALPYVTAVLCRWVLLGGCPNMVAMSVAKALRKPGELSSGH